MNTSPADPGRLPVLLVSATDSSGAAGMAVDIRVAERLGAPCRLAVTAVTVQGRGGVIAVHPQPPSLIASAIAAAFRDPPGAGAVKVGVLADAATAGAVAEALEACSRARVPVVVDPVLRATSGGDLLDPDGLAVLIRRILPLTTLLTPNRDELARLAAACGAGGEGGEEQAARLLLARGAAAVLVKGGEGAGPVAVDTLYQAGGSTRFEHPRSPGLVPRGTGCALSAAIACGLARGESTERAVEAGIRLIQELIRGSRAMGADRVIFPCC